MGVDGGWGWAVVAAAFIVCVLGDGVRYSYGLLYIEFLAEFQRDKGATSWIGSIMFGTYGLSGPFAGMVIDKLGCRVAMIFGCLVSAASFVISMFATSIYYLYFSFGLLGGIGNVFMMLPLFVVIVQYFDKRRSLAMGITVCGSGFGAMIFNPLSKFLIDEYTWRGALLIESGLLLNGCLLASVMRPIVDSPNQNQDTHCTNTELQAMVEDTNTEMVDCESEVDGRQENIYIIRHVTSDRDEDSAMLQLNPETSNSLDTVTPAHSTNYVEYVTTSTDPSNKNNNREVTVLGTLRKIYRFELLKNGGIVICMLSTVFFGLAYMVPFMFLPDMALWMGFTRQDATWMLTTIGIANVVVRIPAGVVGDKGWVSRWKMYVVSRMVTGVLMAVMVLARNYVILMAICTLYGLALGISIVLMPLVLADMFGDDLIADSFGLVVFGGGISTLTGPPLSGWLFDATGAYTTTFITAGVEYFIGGVIMLLVPRFQTKH